MALVKDHYHDVAEADLGDPQVIGPAAETTSFTEDVTFAAAVTFQGDVVFENLPVADPLVAGQIWNNAGVLTVSAG